MIKLFTLVFLILFISNSYSQTIQVLSSKSNQAIEGVLLLNEHFSTQTDSEGKANITMFANNDRILFTHASFLQLYITKSKIENQGNTVYLIDDPVRINEVTISAIRWEQPKTETSQTIETIDREEILRYNPQTAADLIGQKGGVFIQKSQMGGGSPMIRGFSANRLLIVLDGFRMNNAIYRNGNLQNIISVDGQSVENSEIIFGPGSVIYGSDALGGVMSFNTLKPKLSTTDNNKHEGKIFSRISSANFEKTINAAYNFGTKKWAAVFNATFTDFDDLFMGENGPDEYLRPEYVLDTQFDGSDEIIQNKNQKNQKYTGYNQFNAMGKVRYRPNEEIDIIVSTHHSQTGDIPRYDRLIEYKSGKLNYGEWYYGPQIWTLYSGQIQYSHPHLLFDRISILTGYQHYTESRNDRKLNKPERFERTEQVGIYSLNMDFGKQLGENDFFYGFEGYFNKVNSKGISNNLLTGKTEEIAPRYPDGSAYQSGAGYASYKYKIWEKLILEAGARYTFTHLEGVFDNQYYHFPFDGFNMNNSALNGNIGAVWHPTKNWQINMHISSGFRSPNIDDAAKVFDSEPGHVVVPNPNLQPEYARSYELHIMRSYSRKALIEINGFYTKLTNAMVRRNFTLNGQDSMMYDGTMSKIEALVNAESATIWGVDILIEYLFSNTLRTHNEITFTWGHDSGGFPLRHVPPTFGSSHLIFEKQKLFIDLFAVFNGKLGFDELAPDEQDKPHLYLPDENGNPYSPSWWTLNLKSTWKMKPNIEIGTGIENILNMRYRSYSSGVVSQGTNLVVSVLAKF